MSPEEMKDVCSFFLFYLGVVYEILYPVDHLLTSSGPDSCGNPCASPPLPPPPLPPSLPPQNN